MHRMGKLTPADELNCGACGYDTCREHAIAIYKGLAESEMCLPNTIDQLRMAVKEVEASHEQLAAAQEALMQSEKLASMGQLGRRHRPRSEQSAGRRADVRPPAAGRLRAAVARSATTW